MRKIKIHLFTLMLVAPMLALPNASLAQANNQRFDFDSPFSFITYNECNGDFIAVAGRIKGFTQFNTDGSGGFHYQHHFTETGKGYGLTTGDRYQVIGNGNFGFNDNNPSSCQVEQSGTQMFKLVSQGQGDNYVVRFRYRFTRNSRCEVTVSMSDFKIECQGNPSV